VSARDLHRPVRPSPIFWAIVAATASGGALSYWVGSTANAVAHLGVFILVIGGWVVSLCLHEFGHAFTAWRFGDRDIALRGYLDLDPRRYTHPVLSIVLPIVITAIGGIGLPGAAVYVRTSFMTATRRTLVALAGPAANLVLAALLLGLTNAFYAPGHPVFWKGVAFLAFLQITALLLNLLPIPGFDGYSALEPHLSRENQRALDQFKPYGFVVLFLLFMVPALDYALVWLVNGFFQLCGVSPVLWQEGLGIVQFWRD
jgi:Zn-dependent protease